MWFSMDFSAYSASNWVVQELVVVKYPKDDLVGIFFGFYSLLVYQIQAVYITLFLWNRDLLTFYCCFTHLLSEILNYLLKHTLKLPRPENGPPGGGLFEGRFGMPSQHCHCFAYLFTIILLLVFHYYRHCIGKMKKLLTVVITSLAMLLQIAGRIYLRYHTIDQCLVGLAFGTLSAITFYTLGLYLFMPYGEDICRFSLLKVFSFRKDLISPIPHQSLIKASSSRTKSYKPKLKSG